MALELANARALTRTVTKAQTDTKQIDRTHRRRHTDSHSHTLTHARTHSRTHTHTHTHTHTLQIHALLVTAWYNEKKTTDQYAEDQQDRQTEITETSQSPKDGECGRSSLCPSDLYVSC